MPRGALKPDGFASSQVQFAPGQDPQPGSSYPQ